MGRIIPSILWKINFMFETTNQSWYHHGTALPKTRLNCSARRPRGAWCANVPGPWPQVMQVMGESQLHGNPVGSCTFLLCPEDGSSPQQRRLLS